MDHAGFERAGHDQAARREHLEHAIVLAEHVGLELGDIVQSGDTEEMLEQNSPDPPALVLVGDRERRVRRARRARDRGIPTDADDALLAALAECGNQRRPLDEVEPREAVELVVSEPPLCAEEAEVDRAGAQPLEVLDQALAVVRPDGANVDRSTVAEELFDRVEPRIVDARLSTTGCRG